MVIVRVNIRLAAVKRRENFGLRIAGKILGHHPSLVHELEQADQWVSRPVVVVSVRVVVVGVVVRLRGRVVAVTTSAALDLDEL